MSRIVLFLGLLVVSSASAQVRSVDIRADSSALRMLNGRQVAELFGVQLTQETARLRARRAIDHGTGEFHFYQNVRIIDEGDTLTADEVRYNRFTKIGKATGRVRLGDGEVVVTAPEGDFDLDAHRADFRAGVRLVDSVSVLVSNTGSYWTEEKRAEFFGDVRLDSDETDVLADSLTYERDGRRSDARGQVIIVRRADSTETMILSSRAVNDDSLGTGLATGDVLVARFESGEVEATADTLLIRADRVYSSNSDSGDQTAASGSVVVWDPGFSALADSVWQYLSSNAGRSESRLYGDPVIWVDDSQVSGDSIRVSGLESSIDSLQVFGTSYVARRDTVINKLQQLKGKGLVGRFAADTLRSLEVWPNAEAVYYNRDDQGQLKSGVQVSADRIRFLLANGEITDLKVYDGIGGTMYPTEIIQDNLNLDGLRWRPDEKPDPDLMRDRLQAALERFRANGPRSDD